MFRRFGTELPLFYCVLLLFGSCSPLICKIDLTAAVGLCLEKMSKEELDETKDVLRLILPGVSCRFSILCFWCLIQCYWVYIFLYLSFFSIFGWLPGRLESPLDLVRKMASAVALTLSKVIDPKNPLYLDDSLTGDIIDWEFGLTTKKSLPNSNFTEENLDGIKTSATSMREEKLKCITSAENDKKGRKNKSSEYKLIDPDEIVDPATLNYQSVSDQDDDNASETSDSLSDSSLQPYDLSDDDDDLKRNFSQLVDVVGALRKSDDADGVSHFNLLVFFCLKMFL